MDLDAAPTLTGITPRDDDRYMAPEQKARQRIDAMTGRPWVASD
jgi:hypothetical protein